MTAGVVPIRRALVSVSDKAALPDLVRGLSAAGVAIVSTGSTAAVVRAAGVAVTEVSDVTGFPEILNGRVKTLHPRVHAGILADRSRSAHTDTLRAHGIDPIDLVVVNLYPFREALAGGATPAEAVEQIDIGGPALARAAAKNAAAVGVVVDPADYPEVLKQLRAAGGLDAGTRRALAAKAFAVTAAYDAAVAAWLADADEVFPERLVLGYRRAQVLRYGENPHQAGALYVEDGPARGVAAARQVHGKQLSYNNLLDAEAAWAMAGDFAEPCVAIVKHTNPAGLALGDSLAAAYPAALAGDPTSAFGGIVAVNRTLDAATAEQILEVFTEVVLAPGYAVEALDRLRRKANLRLLELPPRGSARPARQLRSIDGGLLVQDADVGPDDERAWTVPTRAAPDPTLLDDLRFAWRACRHVKSNAIVLACDRALVGVGAGQMSRVDSVRLAVAKSAGRSRGAVLASDAFFPFRDGPDEALEAGVTAIIQPGGSVRDAEVVAACDERGVPMVFTGRRHFRH